MAKAKQVRKSAPVRTIRPTSRKGLSAPAMPSKKLAGKNLERAVEQFQSEPDDKKAHEQWRQIETSIFGVQFED
jgi:hypothetical protein